MSKKNRVKSRNKSTPRDIIAEAEASGESSGQATSKQNSPTDHPTQVVNAADIVMASHEATRAQDGTDQPDWMKNLQDIQVRMKHGSQIEQDVFRMAVLEAFVGLANGLMNVSSNMEKNQIHFMSEIKGLREENLKLRQEVNEMKNELRRVKGVQLGLEERVDSPECLKAKRGLVIRNFKEAQNDQDELLNQNSLISHLSSKRSSIEAIYRINISKKAKERFEKAGQQVERLLLIRFNTVDAKYAFMSELPKLRSFPGGDKIHVTHEIPLCRLKEQRELDRLGAEWRKECKGRRTRLGWQGTHLVLQSKEPGQANWVAHSLNELLQLQNQQVDDISMSPEKAPSFWQET